MQITVEMVASKLSSFLHVTDKFNVAIGSWAEESGREGHARCKYCHKDVKFAAGKNELIKHSETNKHRLATPKSNNLVQISMTQALQQGQEEEMKDIEMREKTQEFEISLARCLSNHNIAAEFIECLQRQLKKHCNDSVVVQRMKIGKKKCQVMAREGIATIGLLFTNIILI